VPGSWRDDGIYKNNNPSFHGLVLNFMHSVLVQGWSPPESSFRKHNFYHIDVNKNKFSVYVFISCRSPPKQLSSSAAMAIADLCTL